MRPFFSFRYQKFMVRINHMIKHNDFDFCFVSKCFHISNYSRTKPILVFHNYTTSFFMRYFRKIQSMNMKVPWGPYKVPGFVTLAFSMGLEHWCLAQVQANCKRSKSRFMDQRLKTLADVKSSVCIILLSCSACVCQCCQLEQQSLRTHKIERMLENTQPVHQSGLKSLAVSLEQTAVFRAQAQSKTSKLLQLL